jgi:hypothetical protein
MKSLIILSFLTFVTNAQAAWTVVKCSNADGSVRWESGVEENIIHLKYANFVEGTLSLDLNKVSIQFSKEVLLRERAFNDCQVKSHGRVFAANVLITASEKHPQALKSQFPENRVQTDVICSEIQGGKSECLDY